MDYIALGLEQFNETAANTLSGALPSSKVQS